MRKALILFVCIIILSGVVFAYKDHSKKEAQKIELQKQQVEAMNKQSEQQKRQADIQKQQQNRDGWDDWYRSYKAMQ